MQRFNTLISYPERMRERTMRTTFLAKLAGLLFIALLIVFYQYYLKPRHDIQAQIKQLNETQLAGITFLNAMRAPATAQSATPTITDEQLNLLREQHKALQALIQSDAALAPAGSTNNQSGAPAACGFPIRHCGLLAFEQTFDSLERELNQAQATMEQFSGETKALEVQLAASDHSTLQAAWNDMPGTVKKNADTLRRKIKTYDDLLLDLPSFKRGYSESKDALESAKAQMLALVKDSDSFESRLSCLSDLLNRCTGTAIPEPEPEYEHEHEHEHETTSSIISEITILVPPDTTQTETVVAHDQHPVLFEDCQVKMEPGTLWTAFDKPFLTKLIDFENSMDAFDALQKQHIVIQVVGSHDERSAGRCTLYGHNGMLALARANRMRGRITYLLNGLRQAIPELEYEDGYLPRFTRDIIVAPSHVVLRQCIEEDSEPLYSNCRMEAANPNRYARVEIISSADQNNLERDALEYTRFSALHSPVPASAQ